MNPIPMFLTCAFCGFRHIDEGEFATKAHHTHSCQHCGLTWRPAIEPTVGVQFLPGFKNEPAPAIELHANSGCWHPEHLRKHGGYDGKVIPRYPLRHGSAEVEICLLCEMWRLNVHAPLRWNEGPYVKAYEQRLRDDEDA